MPKAKTSQKFRKPRKKLTEKKKELPAGPVKIPDPKDLGIPTSQDPFFPKK